MAFLAEVGRAQRPISGPAPKIALMTPYTGGNLGDAAIQESAIHGIRRRRPDADIMMISLSPATTSRLHGVRSFPIGISTFPPGFEVTPQRESGAREPPDGKVVSALRGVSHSLPPLRMASRMAFRILHDTWFGAGVREIRHIFESIAVMRGTSILVVSGGGQIDDYWGGPFRHPYALLKWVVIGRLVGAKCVFLSVGVCALQSRLSRFFVTVALRLAHYRSYRDAESKRRLKDLPFADRDPVCPDLAFGYQAPSTGRGSSSAGRSSMVVGVSPIAYLSKHRWPEKDDHVAGAYRASLVEFIVYLLNHDYEVVLFSTDPVDRKVIKEILSSPFGERGVLGEHPRLSAPYSETLEQLAPVMTEVDIVVASRLHGVILSHVAWKPVLAISYDRKVDTHMSDVGMSDYCLDIHTVDARSLESAFEGLRQNADLTISQLHEVTTTYGNAVDNQFTRIFNSQSDIFGL